MKWEGRIAAIQGDTNRNVQSAMWRFVRRWTDRNVRIVGAIEEFESDLDRRHSARLANLVTGRIYPLFQELGPMAEACHLDGAGVVSACTDICNEITKGCELVVLSKFGQLEAARSGLIDAFTLATEHNIPILTAVSPVYDSSWKDFSAPLGIMLRADDRELDAWWLRLNHSS